MKKALIYIALIGFCTVGCSIFKMGDTKKNEVSLSRISGMPVRSTDYKPGKKYISDYEVLSSHRLSDSDTIKIAQILSSDSLIIKGDNHRSCEFSPVYALKWTSGKTILISLSPCAKMQVINKAADPVLINDLKDHNELESWLLKKDTTASK